MLKVKFKKLHEDAVLPSYASEGDAGLDITTIDDGRLVASKEGEERNYYVEYRTGLAVEIPHSHMGLLFTRSSISKKALILANSVGIIDSKFRQEFTFRFKLDAGIVMEEHKDKAAVYKKGDRIGQLVIMPFPAIEPEFADDLSDTTRGAGYGSSGS